MKQLRRVHPLYFVALILFIVALVASALTADTSGGVSRSASVYDTGPGGTAALRNYLEAMGASTTTVQGDTFAADPSQVGVLFMLGPSETFTQFDVDAVRRFVTAGGTAVLATDAGILDGAVLDRFDLHVAGALGPGQYPVGGIAFADPPAHAIALDRGITLSLGAGRIGLASTSGRTFVALAREGTGSLIVVGSVAPFLTAELGEADNGRFALALAAPAMATRRTVAFDEYHHGAHPSPDLFVLLQGTWLGRALLFAGATVFGYLLLSGRRLGPPLPADPRSSAPGRSGGSISTSQARLGAGGNGSSARAAVAPAHRTSSASHSRMPPHRRAGRAPVGRVSASARGSAATSARRRSS